MRETTEFMLLQPLCEDGDDPLEAKQWRVRLRVSGRDFHGAARSALRSLPALTDERVMYVCREDTRNLRSYEILEDGKKVSYVADYGPLFSL